MKAAFNNTIEELSNAIFSEGLHNDCEIHATDDGEITEVHATECNIMRLCGRLVSEGHHTLVHAESDEVALMHDDADESDEVVSDTQTK